MSFVESTSRATGSSGSGARSAPTGKALHRPEVRRLRYASARGAAARRDALVDIAEQSGFSQAAASPEPTDWSHAARRVDPRLSDADTFVRRLAKVPWFVSLGVPSHGDAGVVRIQTWDEWGGPEEETCQRLDHCYAEWLDDLAQLPHTRQWRSMEKKVRRVVTKRASWNVPDFDPSEDAWHPPTACVLAAAGYSALIAKYLLFAQSVPTQLVEIWFWLARGHWPGAYEEGPDGGAGQADRLLTPGPTEAESDPGAQEAAARGSRQRRPAGCTGGRRHAAGSSRPAIAIMGCP